MNHRFGPLLLAGFGLVSVQGCHCFHSAHPPAQACAPCTSGPAGGVLPPHRLMPVGAAPVLPAGPVTPPPPPTALQAPVDVRGYEPPPAVPAEESWRPAPNAQIRLAIPEASPPAPPSDNTRLLPPEPPLAQTPPPRPVVTEDRIRPRAAPEDRAGPLPVGIPQFAEIREGVAAGLKPNLDGGLDWLQARRYRTVLHLRAPGEEDAADRREVEKRGLKYLSLEVSPETLTPAVVDQFNRRVGDAADYPLFVYDKDGLLTGGMWYLYFRTVDRATDEAARARAKPLGLKENGDPNRRAMWLAIQKYLSTASH